MGCDSSRLRKKEEPERPEYVEPRKVISSQPKKKHNTGQKQNPTRGKPPKYRTKIDSRVLAKYDVKALIGRGSFSDVLRVENKLTKQPYAVKILRLKNQHSKEVSQSELRALTRVRHPYVIQLIEVFESKECVYLVMELATGGELYERIKMKGQLTEKESIRVLQMILDGVIYLHGKGITHRDLKPENLLFYHPGQDSKILITDFGFAKTTTKSSENCLFTTWCGTPEYTAPELLCKKPYTNSVDLWAIGVITYVMISGHLPFAAETPSKLYQQIVRAKYSYSREVWKHTSQGAKDFIDKLLHVEPEKRLKAIEARKESWVNSVPPLASHKGHSSKYLSSQASGKSSKTNTSLKSPVIRQRKFEDEAMSHGTMPLGSLDNEKMYRNSRRAADLNVLNEDIAEKKFKESPKTHNGRSNDLAKEDIRMSNLNHLGAESLAPNGKEKPESTITSFQEEFPSAAATEDSNSFASRAEASPSDNELIGHEFAVVAQRDTLHDGNASQGGVYSSNIFANDTGVATNLIGKYYSEDLGRNPLDLNIRDSRGLSWRNPRRGELDLMFAPLQKSRLNWYMQDKASVIEKVGSWLEEQNGYAKEERLSNSHGDIDRINKSHMRKDRYFDHPLLQYGSTSAASSPIKYSNGIGINAGQRLSSESSEGMPVHENERNMGRPDVMAYLRPELSLQLSTKENDQTNGEINGMERSEMKPVIGLTANEFRGMSRTIDSHAMQIGEYNGNIFSD